MPQPNRRALLGPDWTLETRALVAAMTVPPAGARVAQIDTLIKSLKAADVWRLLDVLYLLAAHDSQAARLNWKSPGAFTLSPFNAPTFLADRGYTGDGVTAYIDTGYNPGDGGNHNLKRDSAFAAIWTRTEIVDPVSGFDFGGGDIAIGPFGSSKTAYFTRLNSGSLSVPLVGNANFYSCSRSNANNYDVYQGASLLTTHNLASSAVVDSSLTFFKRNGASAFTSNQISVGMAGAALTAAQIAALYAALAIYMAALGA